MVRQPKQLQITQTKVVQGKAEYKGVSSKTRQRYCQHFIVDKIEFLSKKEEQQEQGKKETFF